MKKILRYSLLISVAFIAGILGTRFMEQSNTQTSQDISLQESFILSKDPSTVILDVRPAEDLKNGHLSNAINIDVTTPEFMESLNKLDKNTTYLVYCNVGQRSAKAIQKMQQAGFTKIYHMKDGIVKWKKEGLPFEE